MQMLLPDVHLNVLADLLFLCKARADGEETPEMRRKKKA